MLNPHSLRLLFRSLNKPSKCRFASSPSSPTADFLARVGRSRKTVSIETKTKPDSEFYAEKPEYPPVREPFASIRPESLKAEKEEFAEFVKSLPTVQEKIFTVNPYERPWTKAEKTWHRDYMHPQSAPRPVFRVHSIPDHYNLLPFYQFITRTHVIDGLPSEFYEKQKNIDREIEEFIPLAMEVIQNEQQSFADRRFSLTTYIYNVAEQLTTAVCNLFSMDYPHLEQGQVSRASSLQAFWVRGGFHSLYPPDDKKPATRHDFAVWGREIFGDDRRRQGEFAFCLREKIGFSMRNKNPLPEIVPLGDPLCQTPVTPYVYAPLTIGLLPDKDGRTYMTPGYEYGNPFEFNSVQYYPIDNVIQRIVRYSGAEPKECFEECLRSASVTLSFATLIGEAHCLGFTQYNDLTYPLTTQLILTDGQNWHFSIYQLNSISLIDHWNEAGLPSNLVWCSGPMKLFESASSMEGMNKDVLKMLLRFLLLEPKTREGVVMRPFLLDENADADLVKSAKTHSKAITSVRE